jgi:DNA-binding PadR family transcriptional regulator
MTPEAIDAVLAAGVLDGTYEISHVDENGEKHYRMTEKGKRETEEMLRSHGIDSTDEEAIRAFMRGL